MSIPKRNKPMAHDYTCAHPLLLMMMVVVVEVVVVVVVMI